MKRSDLEIYLESLLAVARFRDYCPNGLQVEGRAEVSRIVTGVTASRALLEAAASRGADAVIVHHGYFWRGEDARITGMKRHRLALLLKHDISLLAYHLPLDAHPELGNNAQLGRRLDLDEEGRFGDQDIAARGRLARPMSLRAFGALIAERLGRSPLVVGDESRMVERVGWCTGAAQDHLEAAVALGVDAFISGEVSEQTVHVARETGIAFIAAGHHATERYGVQALGGHLAERFGLQHEFVDIPNPV